MNLQQNVNTQSDNRPKDAPGFRMNLDKVKSFCFDAN